MSSLVLSGDTSGTVSLSVPAVAGTNTLTIQAGTGTNSMNTLATSVPSTSGTSINFTDIPSWVKRITVMLNAVSTSGSSNILVQIGSTSISTSGYFAMLANIAAASASGSTVTNGFQFTNTGATSSFYGNLSLVTLGSNIWNGNGSVFDYTNTRTTTSTGAITLGGTLDRVRITTVNGTDTFDAGTVNILYEG